eukprot:g3607.t1
MFVDDSFRGAGSHYAYSTADIEALQTAAAIDMRMINGEIPTGRSRRRGRGRGRGHGRGQRIPESREWVLRAVNSTSMQGKTVLIVGTVSPWAEALCLELGAKSVTTLEYNNLTLEHERLETITEWPEAAGAKFDVALAISSLDHDGLGRYGDPICPDQDMMTMDKLRGYLGDAGKLVFTVPVGPDLLIWNLMRRYGRQRLPLILQGFRIVTTFGWEPWRLDVEHAGKPTFRQAYEPAFVLEKVSMGSGETPFQGNLEL